MIRYLALGDSYTIGEGVGTEGTWPYRLAMALADRLAFDSTDAGLAYRSLAVVPDTGDPSYAATGVPEGDTPALSVDVVARTGCTADELLGALDRASTSPPYDLVSVLIGVNDQYRDREIDEHLPYFNTVLNHAIAYADGDASRVFVVSIPDWGVTGFAGDDRRGRDAIAEAIDAYNGAQRELCGMRGIAYVDITPLSRALAPAADMFVEDRLHPSDAQYARWTDVILPVARARLGG